MTVQIIVDTLAQVPVNFASRDAKAIKQDLARFKAEFVAQNEQEKAKLIWCLEGVIDVQEHYCEAFANLKAGQFYAAWSAFERAEIDYHFLRQHLPQPHAVFLLDFILTTTKQWQSLFPYLLFSSLEFIHKRRECSICGQVVSLRKSCGHLKSEIYDGEMCGHKITDIDFISISLVTNPHCKYAVLFPQGKDPNSNATGRFDPLIHAIERLETPFDIWQTFHGKRELPRDNFNEQDPDSFCRCGSMEYFKDCCFDKPSILIPWVHLEFGDPQNYVVPDFLISNSTKLNSDAQIQS